MKKKLITIGLILCILCITLPLIGASEETTEQEKPNWLHRIHISGEGYYLTAFPFIKIRMYNCMFISMPYFKWNDIGLYNDHYSGAIILIPLYVDMLYETKHSVYMDASVLVWWKV